MRNEAEIELVMLAWEFSPEETHLVREAMAGGFMATANAFLETIVQHKKDKESYDLSQS